MEFKEKFDLVCRLAEEGWSDQQISEEVGTSRSYIREFRKRNGILNKKESSETFYLKQGERVKEVIRLVTKEGVEVGKACLHARILETDLRQHPEFKKWLDAGKGREKKLGRFLDNSFRKEIANFLSQGNSVKKAYRHFGVGQRVIQLIFSELKLDKLKKEEAKKINPNRILNPFERVAAMYKRA